MSAAVALAAAAAEKHLRHAQPGGANSDHQAGASLGWLSPLLSRFNEPPPSIRPRPAAAENTSDSRQTGSPAAVSGPGPPPISSCCRSARYSAEDAVRRPPPPRPGWDSSRSATRSSTGRRSRGLQRRSTGTAPPPCGHACCRPSWPPHAAEATGSLPPGTTQGRRPGGAFGIAGG